MDEGQPKKSKWELIRKKSGGQALEEDEKAELKAKLYPYLKDKAARRGLTTGSNAYEGYEQQFAEDQGRYDAGALLGAVSKMQSQAGTLGGKRSDVEIVEPMNKALNDSSQQRYKNELAMREMEEGSLGTDLRVAQFVSGLDEKDKARKFEREKFEDGQKDRTANRQFLYDRLKAEAEARKQKPKGSAFKESDMIAPDGTSYVFDPETGGYRPSGLPRGAKPYRQPAAAGQPGFGSVIPGYTDADGNPITYNPKTGKSGTVALPPGSKSTKTEAQQKLSEDERKRAQQTTIALNELQTLEGLETTYKPGWREAAAGMMPDSAANYVRSEEDQRYSNATIRLADAMLRSVTGAGITREEMLKNLQGYAVRPGDSPKSIADKKSARRAFIQGMLESAGKGATGKEMPPDQAGSPGETPVGTVKPGKGGKKYKKAAPGPDADKSLWEEVP